MAKTSALLLCFVVAMTIMTSLPKAEAGIFDCYETWSRCTRWSSAATGYLWKSCHDRCRELGRRSGRCRLAPSRCPFSSQAWQCQCY